MVLYTGKKNHYQIQIWNQKKFCKKDLGKQSQKKNMR